MEQRPSDFSGSFREKPENQKFELDTRNLKFFKEDIFNVPFKNLSESSNYKHFKHVFVDEDDYEDFKHDLVNFHHLRSRWKDDRKKVSKERPRIFSSVDADSDSHQRDLPLQAARDTARSFSLTSDDFDEEIDRPRSTLERQKRLEFKHSDSLERGKKIEVKRTNSSEGKKIEVKRTNSSEGKKVEIKRTNSSESRRELQIQHTGSLERRKDRGIRQKEFAGRQHDDSDLNFMFKPLPMMEFFQNDEHFQEFDRVFETVKNKRRYASNSSLDKYRWSPRHEGDKSDDDTSDSDLEEGGVFKDLKVDDIFSDFFDNDADFKNFEEEFQNFQIKRRSKALERWHTNSVCDLIEDLKAFCDSEDPTSSNKTSLPVENKLSLPKLWNQGGEWDYIFNKIRGPGQAPSVGNSDTGRSDLTVRCDSESGNYLLDDVSDTGSCRDTGYYSESSKYNTNRGTICSECQRNSNPGKLSQCSVLLRFLKNALFSVPNILLNVHFNENIINLHITCTWLCT